MVATLRRAGSRETVLVVLSGAGPSDSRLNPEAHAWQRSHHGEATCSAEQVRVTEADSTGYRPGHGKAVARSSRAVCRCAKCVVERFAVCTYFVREIYKTTRGGLKRGLI